MSDLCPMAVAKHCGEDAYQPQTARESRLLLLKQKNYCDVIFTFPNLPDIIEAHEVCLQARSPVFTKIFRMRKSKNVRGSQIEVSDSTPEIFQQFLEFIYADKFEVDIAGALELMQLSQKYKVHPLTEKCEELLNTEIPIVDSIKIFETARRLCFPELMDRAGQVIVKSFWILMKLDALAFAEEETLAYSLNSDDLTVKEVELFQIILNWGKNQAGTSTDEELLRNKLQNLISNVRYTNMTPDEFTKVVVPTGLLSAEETIAVYTYFCGDEETRSNLKIKFNTSKRKQETGVKATICIDFYVGQPLIRKWFPAFYKHCISFKAPDQTQFDGKVLSNSLLKKTVITAIEFQWPIVNCLYEEDHVLNFNLSIGEYSKPASKNNFTPRFQKKLLNCEPFDWDISVEPPVELISGRTYTITVEDNSASDLNDRFREDLKACSGLLAPNVNRDAHVHVEDGYVGLKEIYRSTDYYAQKKPDSSGDLALIRGIKIEML